MHQNLQIIWGICLSTDRQRTGAVSPPVRLAIEIPFGEVDLAASVVDILFDHPRHRWNAAIPWPLSILQMAVLARPLKQEKRPRVDLRTFKQGLRMSERAARDEAQGP
jgi:hypothetical protein